MLLPILQYPDPRLHQVAREITEINEQIRQIATDMAETMYYAKGVGLAATQVNIHQRLVVIDVSEQRDQLIVLINPQLISKNGEKISEEGCLSVPGVHEKVHRADTVSVSFYDLAANKQQIDADGLLAVCIQHEIDHLNGIVFVQHLSRLKQGRIKQKLIKQARA